MTRYALNPAMPVLLRPDGVVQVGWDPRRAVLVRPPAGLSSSALAELLRTLQSGTTLAALQARFGVDAGELVASLVDAGVVTTAERRRTRAASIRIHGRGPLSDLLAGALRCSRPGDAQQPDQCGAGTTDLVVLSDFLVAIHGWSRTAHRPGWRTRRCDSRRRGAGRPAGHSGCDELSGCADLHRSDRDAGGRRSPQLRDTVGSADRATVLATAALALNQVDRVIRAVRRGDDVGTSAEPPPTLDTTLEFDVNAGAIVARRWSRHPRCWC
jgi:hypothetical protein